jgi:hypothetical protein
MDDDTPVPAADVPEVDHRVPADNNPANEQPINGGVDPDAPTITRQGYPEGYPSDPLGAPGAVDPGASLDPDAPLTPVPTGAAQDPVATESAADPTRPNVLPSMDTPTSTAVQPVDGPGTVTYQARVKAQNLLVELEGMLFNFTTEAREEISTAIASIRKHT